MTSAWIQAVLATIFALLAAWEWFLRQKHTVPGKKLHLVFYAFNQALDVFVNGALILSLCINVAAFALMLQRKDVSDGTQLALAHDMVVFSFSACLFPTIMHEQVHGDSGRTGSRYLILFIDIILYLVVGNMVPIVSNKFESTDSWEVYCFWDIIPTERRFTSLIVWVTGILFWAWVLKIMDVYIIGVYGFLAWYILITITVIRQLLLQRSGFGSEDLRWSFGQILSLGTWLPVLIELYYLFKKGPPETGEDGIPNGQAASNDPSSLPTSNSPFIATDQQSQEASEEDTGLLLENMQRPGMSSQSVSNASLLSLESGSRQTPRSTTF
ncbi:hypothetical protein B0H63DRAFT_520381 [Podospora didyma]|uniref:Uncharacterized protein n=1 Tax=Podospora didyma TaxID=330526 RepID=A0AAE0P0U6_9PEZI|nr:hypothetical protein B0H63DRAFT_520381 [Podospora didyma]